MKKFWLGALLLCSTTAMAQTRMRVWQNGDSDRMKLKEMSFSNSGQSVTIGDNTYTTTSIDSIVMVQEVGIVYSGSTATVTVPKAIENDIIVTQNGAHVNIFNNNMSNEVEFNVSGTTTNGSLNYRGDYKCTFSFDNLSITNPDSSAVSLKCGKRVALKLIGANTLVDGAGGDQKGCLYCKGHLEIEGDEGNTLTITANAKHGICTKEYLQLKKSCGDITFASVAGDAIHVGDSDDTEEERAEEYFQMNGGNITATIEKNEDCKGIRVAGNVILNAGTVSINAKSNGSRGIQTDGNMTIGTTDATENTPQITISAAGGKCTVEADADDPHKCMGIKVDGNLTVNSGTTKVTNTGKKSKGIKVGGTYSKEGGTVDAEIESD